MSDKIQCCTTNCEIPLGQSYWDSQYKSHTTGWDLGAVSPPIKSYFEKVENKNLAILIPGCGNTYEAEFLLQQGFTNITVIDIAPTLAAVLQEKFKNNESINIVLGDFFDHQGKYDVIVEQTFFCALPQTMRQRYVNKMHSLLNSNGLLVGLLFNRSFEKSPPFGGSKTEYEHLFAKAFTFLKLEDCVNSAAPRANSELWIEFKKNNDVIVNLYTMKAITSVDNITKQVSALDNVVNVSISSDFSELLIVSTKEIDSRKIQDIITTHKK
jgi:SAM-dependent methyltransferase